MTIAEMMARAKNDYDEVFEAGKRAPGESLHYIDVESNSYISVVPDGVDPFAKVNKIGGMTYRSKNKIPFPYTKGEVGDSEEINGVTFTILHDGGISVVGRPRGVFTWDFWNYETFDINNEPTIHYIPIPSGITYTLSGATDGVHIVSKAKDRIYGSPAQWCESYNDGTCISMELWDGYVVDSIGLYFDEGSTVTEINTVIYPMLAEGSFPLPFEPYFAGLRSAWVSELKSEFGNLFNYDNIYDGCKGTGEYEGKIHVKSTGFSYNLYTGTNSSSAKVPKEYWDKLPYLRKGTYYIYFDIDFYENEVPDEDKVMQARSIINNGEDFWCGTGSDKLKSGDTFTMYEDGYCYLRRYYNKRCIISNLMISRTPRTDYVPHKDERLIVPQKLMQNVSGYSYGVNDKCYSYIDFKREVFVQKVDDAEFYGGEDMVMTRISSEKQRIVLRLPLSAMESNESEYKTVVCNHYPNAESILDLELGHTGCYVKDNCLHIYDPAYQTVDEWRAHLWELYEIGDPLTIVYALAEPIETDISAYFTDKYIEVEGGGTIKAVNEYGYDVPTNISYLIDTQGG